MSLTSKIKIRNEKIEVGYRIGKSNYQIANELNISPLWVDSIIKTIKELDAQKATRLANAAPKLKLVEPVKPFTMSFMQGSDPFKQTRINSIVNSRRGKL